LRTEAVVPEETQNGQPREVEKSQQLQIVIIVLRVFGPEVVKPNPTRHGKRQVQTQEV
jgi:hypothetical protein